MTKTQFFRYMMLLLLKWHLALGHPAKPTVVMSKIKWTEFLLSRIEAHEPGDLDHWASENG